MSDADDPRIARQKLRMGHMPWLYFGAKPAVRRWAEPWQRAVHEALAALEDVEVDPTAFVAEGAVIVAEPRRRVRIGPRASVATGAFVHGPVVLGADCSVNPHATLDGGRAGIELGDGCRIATGARLFAFDHGVDPASPVRTQKVRSRGIRLGVDVWVGANACITDGVVIDDHAVVAMGAVVTHAVPAWRVVGGVPAKVLFDRRSRRVEGQGGTEEDPADG